MKIDSKFIVKVAGTLTAICLVVAALLGGVNAVTADRIDGINRANTEASLKAVAPTATAPAIAAVAMPLVYASAPMPRRMKSMV